MHTTMLVLAPFIGFTAFVALAGGAIVAGLKLLTRHTASGRPR
jgi:hypothetical protein